MLCTSEWSSHRFVCVDYMQPTKDLANPWRLEVVKHAILHSTTAGKLTNNNNNSNVGKGGGEEGIRRWVLVVVVVGVRLLG